MATTTITATDIVKTRRAADFSQLEAIDAAAVEKFVAGAAGATRDQLIYVVQRLHTQITETRGRRDTNLETMAACADRLTAIIAASN